MILFGRVDPSYCNLRHGHFQVLHHRQRNRCKEGERDIWVALFNSLPRRDRDQLSVILTSVVNSLFCFARLVVAPHL